MLHLNVKCEPIISDLSPFSVQKLSAPEKHFLVLMCSDASYVNWSHGLERMIASRQRKQVSYLDQSKHQLLEDGQLSIKDLQESDAGEYYCNHQLVADITVLKGILVVAHLSKLILFSFFCGNTKDIILKSYCEHRLRRPKKDKKAP